MMFLSRYLVIGALVIGLGETSVHPSTALAENHSLPNLTGQWEGSWRGNMYHPMHMNVTKQEGSHVSGFVSFGGGETFPMKGRIETKNGKLRVTVKVDMHGHSDKFEFTTVLPDKLEGFGRGRRHRGPATLTRP